MNISSDSIFHLTKNEEIVCSILKEGFRFSYCREFVQLEKSIVCFYTPIVSFCDIPLSQINKHVDKYGKYGIGLSKNWVQRKRLNPVLYMDKKSILFESYLNLYKELIANKSELNWKDLSEPEKGIIEILRYTKMVQDDLFRGNYEVLIDYKFSDEKEWRLAAEYSENYPMILDRVIVDVGNRKSEMNQLIRNLRLNFEPEDIKYIIFESEDDRKQLIKTIKSITQFTEGQQEFLISKLICYEEIWRDF